MRVGIIAAGTGERLRQGGYTQPKPLVRVAGKPLIDYVLAGVAATGASDVACIVNEASHGIEEHCRGQWPDLQFTFIRRTTPSSMESLFTLEPVLRGGPFLLLTVDAIFAPQVLRDFLTATAAYPTARGVLAVNNFVDDEKPLRVQLEGDGRIRALGPEARDGGLVTAGFYVFDPVIFTEVAAARQRQLTALRQFLGHLLECGHTLYGQRVPKTVDVDRPEDIATAEAFVRGGFVA